MAVTKWQADFDDVFTIEIWIGEDLVKYVITNK